MNLMAKYKCPFCSNGYELHDLAPGTEIACMNCGEDLIKVPVVKATQIIALIAVTAFITPLLALVVSFLQSESFFKPMPDHDPVINVRKA